jgi:hypothetical protein
MQRPIFTFAILALVVGIASVATAQSVPPADVTAPARDIGDPNGRPDVPTLLNEVVLPEVQFIFDGLLDPDRISLIEQVTAANLDDSRLTAAAQSLIRNHLVAMQQVELAIQFLQANRDDILAGNNREFNSVFGNPGELRDVAVVNPTPIQGLARVVVSIGGLVVLDFQDQTLPSLPGQVNAGDFVFVGDAVNGDPLGFVMEVEQVLFDDDASNQGLIGTSTFGGAVVATNRANVPVYRVVSFERRTDPARFERVVQTFAAIRDSLQGISPNLPPLLQAPNPITYQRRFEDINNVWAPGVAPFSTLDEIVRRELDRTGLTSTRTADRLVRQAGFSNSDSHFHLDRLDDQGLAQPVDYRGRQTFPLLWTEDNEIPLNFGANSPVAGAGDEDRAFFRDRQTIFGTPDNPFVQYVGRAFLEETIFHTGDFFDDNISVSDTGASQSFDIPIFDNLGNLVGFQTVTVTDALELDTVRASRPVRGPLVDLDGNPRTTDFDIRQVPESGTPTAEQTERRKWQMIIESFAEHSTNLDLFNVAAVGIGDIFGDFVPNDLRARDAGSYADFAALIGSSSSINTIDVTRIEPFGKRGSAGFNPVVPRN